MEQYRNSGLDQPSEDDMARRSSRAPLAASAQRVEPYVERLKDAGRDRRKFDEIIGNMMSDQSLVAADVCAIAVAYRGGGNKPASKKAAIEIISKRFLELVRDHTKTVQAAKARPF
jgi:hypothetical protein